jgi:hypothetical protein
MAAYPEQQPTIAQDIRRDLREVGRDAQQAWQKDKPVLVEALRKILSYGIEGIALSTAAYAIPALASQNANWSWQKVREILAIGLVAAAVFALLDTYAPRIGGASRIGAGIAIGAMQVGGIPIGRSK